MNSVENAAHDRAGEIQAEMCRAIACERDALDRLATQIDGQCVHAVESMLACKGHVVVTGVGKAGLIGRKIAATLASTGTPAFFLHPADAIHGDLGMVGAKDLALVLSYSGESSEILALLPHLARLGVRVISMTGKPQSRLAAHSHTVLDVSVSREADPLGLAPTASTTAMLALGDALAAALARLRGFTRSAFAAYHPGGSLGNTLLATVRDLMIGGEHTPLIAQRASVREAIMVISSKRLGAVFVTGEAGQLAGIITDGDLRRLFQRHTNPLELLVEAIMTRNPVSAGPELPALDALRLMEDHAITILPVLDPRGRPLAALHLHDLVKAGLALWDEDTGT